MLTSSRVCVWIYIPALWLSWTQAQWMAENQQWNETWEEGKGRSRLCIWFWRSKEDRKKWINFSFVTFLLLMFPKHCLKVFKQYFGNMRDEGWVFFFSTYCMSHITTQDNIKQKGTRSKSAIQESDYFMLCFSKDHPFSIQCFNFTTLDIYSINVKLTCSMYNYRLICKAKVMFTIYI